MRSAEKGGIRGGFPPFGRGRFMIIKRHMWNTCSNVDETPSVSARMWTETRGFGTGAGANRYGTERVRFGMFCLGAGVPGALRVSFSGARPLGPWVLAGGPSSPGMRFARPSVRGRCLPGPSGRAKRALPHLRLSGSGGGGRCVACPVLITPRNRQGAAGPQTGASAVVFSMAD